MLSDILHITWFVTKSSQLKQLILDAFITFFFIQQCLTLSIGRHEVLKILLEPEFVGRGERAPPQELYEA